MWDLEWYNSTLSVWVSVKSDLVIQKVFPKNNTCKVTLIFDASQNGNYRLTFAIDARVRNYVVRLDKYQYVLYYDEYSVVFDWSDVLAVSGLQITHGLTVVDGSDYFWFRIRKDNVLEGSYVVIDPSYVLGATNVAQYMPQRKVHFANGYWWAFWNNGTDIYYSTSGDGEAWSNPTNLTTINGGGSFFEVGYFPNYNASYFYVAFRDAYESAGYGYIATSFCRATINGSSLTWGTEYQVITWKVVATNAMWLPSVGVGTDGYVYVGIDNGAPSNHAFKLYNCSANDGSGTWGLSWTGAVRSYSSTNWVASSIQQLASAKILGIYALGGYTNAYSRVFNGTAWETEVNFATNIVGASYGVCFGASSFNDTVLFAYPARLSPYGNETVGFYNYTYSVGWSARELPTTTVRGATYASLTLDSSSGDCWVLFPDLNSSLRYVKRSNAGVYSAETVWQLYSDEEINGNSPVSTPTTNSTGYIGATWTTDLLNNLRFDCFTTATVTKAWQTIATWTFQLPTRNWATINTWSFQVLTRNWTTINAWSFQALTRQWATISTWSFQIVARQWRQIANWLFTLDVKGWHTIVTWVFSLGGTSNIPVLFVGLAFFGSLALAIVFGYRMKKRRF